MVYNEEVKMKYTNEKRYETFKKVIFENRSKNLGRNNIMTTYMQVLNKAILPEEIDEALDAILFNEEQIKKTGKSKL